MAQALPITAATLAKVVRPFVRAKVDLRKDPNSKYGAYLPRLAAIDILTRGTEWFDADVRAVTVEGVKVYFYDGAEIVPWEKIEGVRIVGMDAAGRRTSVTERKVLRAGEGIAA